MLSLSMDHFGFVMFVYFVPPLLSLSRLVVTALVVLHFNASKMTTEDTCFGLLFVPMGSPFCIVLAVGTTDVVFLRILSMFVLVSQV